MHTHTRHRDTRNEFGNTSTEVRRVAIFGAILGGLIAILFALTGYVQGTLHENWRILIFATLFIGGLVPAIVFVTSLFAICIDEEYVTHVFARRYVLSRYKLADLKRVDLGRRYAAAVFYFCDGSRIRFIGAHLGVIRALCRRVVELKPGLKIES